MRKRTRNGNSGLLSRLSFPIFALIVAIIAFFATAASYILIRVQNDHTHNMADQSMKFVYRNIWYQFDTMNNMAAFILSNPSIENLLESGHKETYEAVDDYFALQTNLENLSLLSLLNDFGSRSIAKKSYVVSIALEPESGLYAMATDRFDPTTGIYKYEDLQDQEWYRSLNRGVRQTEWWGQRTGQSNDSMIYSARTKTSIKDGRSIGTVIVGADTGSIRSVFENAQLEKGYHLLLDESDRVIFSERYNFLESVVNVPYVRALEGASGSLVTRIDGEQHRVMFETFVNGWKLLTVVPESHFNQYTFAISAIGAATAIAALLIAGFILRRIVVRVTVPITRLVSAMQRPEVLEFKESLPEQNSGIYEVDELGQKFAAMLVTLHGLIEKSFAEEMERRQLQLELLHAQINPHFLYNTLDLINCRAIMAGDREASEIVRALANVFRHSLNRGEAWISLEDEFKQVDAYLRIQQMMMDNLHVDLRVPDDLLSASIVHLTLQPLVENAIIHGFADRTSDCWITISARLKGRVLVLSVEDNGRGCDPVRMNRMLREHPGSELDGKAGGVRSGYGTLNVHRRIQLHCGEAFGLKYVDTDEGTRVEVVLPYRQQVGLRNAEVLANV
ncbi:cache domain-containing sensor histidine kinase [Cohnella silvisoli]|uniref:Histidine kinase n=1 Tax=Cohnella silvisoli TaxID=2873699 RepID=A0ABV1KLD4_9BACL|nr:sensor histidine kinase [Cohnella silvisoli]MCD9020731.1 histidine kinase [Cohnella silvisoli]